MPRYWWMSILPLIVLCGIAHADFEGKAIRAWNMNERAAALDDWSGWSSPNTEASFEWTPEAGRDGSGALHTRSQGPKTSLWRTGVRIVPGAAYEFSAWVRQRDAKGRSFLSVRHKNAEGQWETNGNFSSVKQGDVLRGDADWQRLRVRFRAPTSADQVRLHLCNRFGEGDRIWFDDVQLKEIVQPRVLNDGPRIITALNEAADQLSDDAAAGELVKQIDDYVARLKSGMQTLKDAPGRLMVRRNAWRLLAEGVRLRRRVKRQAQLARFRDAHAQAPLATTWVSAMSRVFIDDRPLPADRSASGRLRVFPGEQEAAQLVLVPLTSQKDVRVRITRHDASESGGLRPEHVKQRVVGYVKIEQPGFNHRAPVAFPYAGWWPDPLLNKSTVSLERDHFQPIWLQVDAPRDVEPGDYQFDVSVVDASDAKGEGRTLATTTLDVTVWPHAMPEQWHLGKVFSFSPRLASTADWSGKNKQYAQYGDRWPDVRDAFFSMLIDYRIGIGTSLYDELHTFPMEWLKKADAAGQSLFLTAAGRARYDDAGNITMSVSDRSKIERVFGPIAETLESHGLLHKTYYYGFDEHWPWFFDLAHDVFARAKERGYRTMSTLHDESYGTETVLSDVLDVYVDTQWQYDPAVAAKARSEGRDVWVYTTSDFNIETDAIYQRLRMWKIARLKSSGYLIWCMNRWVGNDELVDDAVRNSWNPRLDGGKPSSSAMMIYPGVNGPISCIRLENARDGIEEYDLLAQTAERMRESGEPRRDAMVRLLEALGVSGEFSSMTASDVHAYRAKLAERRAALFDDETP